MERLMEHAQVKVNPFAIYIGLGLAAALLQHFVPLPFLSLQTVRIVGATLMVISLLFGLPALRKMFTVKTSPNPNRPTTTLISSGPYRFTRNPMYVGLTILYIGVLTFLQISWGLLLLPLIVWLITVLVIHPEEKYLERKFGREYIEYKEKVRMWI